MKVQAAIKGHNFAVGDHVLLRQRKVNKWSTLYEPVFYTVIKSMDLLLLQDVLQTAERFQRYASQFKNANARRMQMMAASMKIEEGQVWWVQVTWKINPFPKGC